MQSETSVGYFHSINHKLSACYLLFLFTFPLAAMQRKMSVTKQIHDTVRNVLIPDGVTRADTYQDGRPQFGGVNDPRMGSTTPGVTCKTCKCSFKVWYIQACLLYSPVLFGLSDND